jgi:hypothetical protein
MDSEITDAFRVYLGPGSLEFLKWPEECALDWAERWKECPILPKQRAMWYTFGPRGPQ